jgi:YD repeat-containing protein
MPRRVKLTRQSDGVALSETSESDGIKTQTIYRTATGGSCQLTSNPHRTIGDATMGWMRTRFDLNRRPVETAHFGATAPGACTDLTGRNGLTTTEYDAITAGPLTKVVEEAEDPDKQRDSITDALGRLKQVTEYEGTTTYPTTYTYDTIDNLTQVSQSGQTRTYAYDSLSRLACASNPESRNTTTPCSLTAPATGVDRFTYDDAGQIESKTDARGARTDYVYDALNRLTDKTFTTAANIAATADVLYCYDGRDYNAGSHACTGSQSAPNVGLLTAVGSSESATRMLYDSLGRVASSQQRTADETYGFTYSYLLNDAIQSVSYPSGRLVTQTYDDAGRMVSGADGATPTSRRRNMRPTAHCARSGTATVSTNSTATIAASRRPTSAWARRSARRTTWGSPTASARRTTTAMCSSRRSPNPG